ncbi:CLUMA_CG003606, isoform A [Clunio marinus]|uniref:CLUMA_CG003606, isoform A n=1 Tax=Clunio marinus TaxID=568069 RepID=A0A1J1HUM9_9DIPT|nr:CLUMA_CG003606, isoform A [Clunio marinus]
MPNAKRMKYLKTNFPEKYALALEKDKLRKQKERKILKANPKKYALNRERANLCRRNRIKNMTANSPKKYAEHLKKKILRQTKKRRELLTADPKKHAEVKKFNRERARWYQECLKKKNVSIRPFKPKEQIEEAEFEKYWNTFPEDDEKKKVIVAEFAKKLGLLVGPLSKPKSRKTLEKEKLVRDYYINDNISQISNNKVWKNGTPIRYMLHSMHEAYDKFNTGTVPDLLKHIEEMKVKFLLHVLVKRNQAACLESYRNQAKSENATTAVLQVDWSQSYQCLQQDEIHAAYWNKKHRVSIFTAMMWHRGEKSMAVALDSQDHTKKTVIPCLHKLFSEEIPATATTVHIFSDNAGGQFKNKYTMAVLPALEKKYNKKIVWHYLAAQHGKSAADGIGGGLKTAARNTSKAGATISDAKTFVKNQSSLSKVTLKLITEEEIKKINSEIGLEDICSNHPLQIKNMRKYHCFKVGLKGISTNSFKSDKNSFSQKSLNRTMVLTRSRQNSTHEETTETIEMSNPTPISNATSMSNENKGSDIEKLTGEENYYPWSIQIKAWLMDLGLWVDFNKTVLSTTERELSKKAYRKIVQKISHPILANVSPLIDEDDGVQLFQKLQEKYFKGNAFTKMNLIFEAFELKLHQNPSLNELKTHIDVLRSKFHRLSMMKGEIQEFSKVACLIRSIPRTFSESISSFHNAKDEDLTFERVSKTIIADYERKNIDGTFNFENSSKAASFSQNKNRKWKYDNLHCSYCNKNGHTAEYCWKKKKNLTNKSSNKNFSNVAEVEDEHAGTFENNFSTKEIKEKRKSSIFERLESRESRISTPKKIKTQGKSIRNIQNDIPNQESYNIPITPGKNINFDEISFHVEPHEYEFMNKEFKN